MYSDIDLRIVVGRDDLDDFVTHKKVRPQRWGCVLFYEDVGPKVAHTIAHFEGFIKVDSFYYCMNDVAPSLFLQSIRILHDPTNFMDEVRRRSQVLTYHPTGDEVERWRYKVLSYAHEVYRRCMRGKLSYARNMIVGLAGFAMTGWHMEAGRFPSIWANWSKAEGPRSVLDSWQQDLLQRWHPEISSMSMLDTLATMSAELSRLNNRLSELTGCDACNEVWNKSWDMVT